MTESAAKTLAGLLGGDATFPMPRSRTWGVLATCPDGRFVAVEDAAGWAYRDRQAYEAYQLDGDPVRLLDAREWGEWDSGERWATDLARLLGGEAHQSGGNVWVVLLRVDDGRFVVVGLDGAEIYQSAEHYETYYDREWPEPEYVYWTE